jgi:anti-anti-sigma regulatory factor
MMLARFREIDGRTVLQVSGRLGDRWVAELEEYWRAGRDKTISVDLRGVTFIDESGERLLRRMHREGATFVAEGLLVREVVNQITGGRK